MNGFVFIRHAETDMAGTFCGHADPPINARGRAQVDDLIASLGSQSFDAIYSSDLRRAVETATPIANVYALPCTTTPLLREIDFGKWEGMTWAQIEEHDAEFARRWLADFPALAAPQGEPYAAFRRRVLQQVNQLLPLAGDMRIAVITHAGVMRVVLRDMMGRTEQEAWTLTKPYCCSFLCTAETRL